MPTTHQGQKRAMQSLRTGITEVLELPCGNWELNPGSLKEQQMILMTEPSLMSSEADFFYSFFQYISFQLNGKCDRLA